MVSFNNPGTINLNENDDSGRSLWAISATCSPSNNDYILGIKVGNTTHTVDCQTCDISSNPDSGLFYISGKLFIRFVVDALF